MTTPNEWKVQVIAFETNEVVKEISAPTERQAGRIDDGLNVNLNHDKFFTVVVSPDGAKE